MNSIFENTRIAFASKTDLELRKSYWLFRLIGSPLLNKIGTLSVQILLKLRVPIEGIIRTTMFNHFCVGTSIEESQIVVKNLKKINVDSCLNYSIEGVKSEIGFEKSLDQILKIIEISDPNLGTPFVVLKPTGFGAISLFKKVSENIELSAEEKEAWQRTRKRFDSCCEKAVERNLKILVDAEESWIQPALDELVEDLMETYNNDKIVVYATIQMYLSNRLPYLKTLLKKAKKAGYQPGIKLVRGAYIEKETAYAQINQLPNPVCPSKEETDKNFDKALNLVLKNLADVAVFVGSHNEESTLKALHQMEVQDIAKDHPRICFAHLFGMSDNISFNLADQGYNVVKYLPYGPIKKVVPYLIRRAKENSSIANQTSREMELIQNEIKRRKQTQKSS
ncbi:MAG: proline dehydrogenase family protein [Flavobacteriaceae bacterium]